MGIFPASSFISKNGKNSSKIKKNASRSHASILQKCGLTKPNIEGYKVDRKNKSFKGAIVLRPMSARNARKPNFNTYRLKNKLQTYHGHISENFQRAKQMDVRITSVHHKVSDPILKSISKKLDRLQ